MPSPDERCHPSRTARRRRSPAPRRCCACSGKSERRSASRPSPANSGWCRAPASMSCARWSPRSWSPSIADTKRYALDAGVLTLARQWLRRDRFADLAQPVLDRHRAQTFGVTMLGVQIVGLDHIVVVAVSQSSAELPAEHPDRQPLPRADQRDRPLHRRVRRLSASAELEARFDTLRWDDPPSFEVAGAGRRDPRRGFARRRGQLHRRRHRGRRAGVEGRGPAEPRARRHRAWSRALRRLA